MSTRMVTVALGALVLAACGEAPTVKDDGPKHAVFYPTLPQQPRVQFLKHVNTEGDLGGGPKQSEFRQFLVGEEESIAKVLARPFAISHSPGWIWIADPRLKHVIGLDLATKTFVPIEDMAGGPLREPLGLFVTPDGYKYVADAEREQIVVFNPRNEYSRTYGVQGQFRPTDVVVRGNKVYVADIRDAQVEILDRESGKLLKVIDRESLGGMQEFARPVHLSLAPDGKLYVVDTFSFRVHVFDEKDRYVKSIGQIGDAPGTFARPKGISVDRDGYMYAVDGGFENVQIFDTQSGKALLFFGTNGTGRGASYLPADVEIDYDNVPYFQDLADPRFKLKYLIYVGNQAGNARLNIYGFGDWLPAKGG